MQRHTLLTLCAAAVFATSALGLATARPTSLGSPTTWQGDLSRDWNTGANWSAGVPAAGDTVIIPNTVGSPYFGDPHLFSGANGVAGDLRIESNRTVTVTGKTLTLNLNVTHDFDGDLFLTNGSSILKFVDNSATVDGKGAIVGQNNGAKIQIEGGDTLTSTMLIHGRLTMETNGGSGNATFVNGGTGIVRANATGTLLFAAGLTLDDDASTSLWEAKSDSSAVLKFDEDATNLIGKFVLCKDATFKFADGVDISTSGCFIVAAANGFLDFLGTPGSFHTDDITCSSGGAGNWSADHEFTGTCTD